MQGRSQSSCGGESVESCICGASYTYAQQTNKNNTTGVIGGEIWPVEKVK